MGACLAGRYVGLCQARCGRSPTGRKRERSVDRGEVSQALTPDSRILSHARGERTSQILLDLGVNGPNISPMYSMRASAAFANALVLA